MNLSDYSLALPPLVLRNPLLSTLSVIAGAAVASLVVEYLARTLDVGRFAWQRAVRKRLGVASDAHLHETKWITLAYQLLLWPFVGFLLLHIWGQNEFGAELRNALTGDGFTLGTVTIVPLKILYGVLWFALLVTFTRWLKSKLEEDWLPLAKIDSSIRVSVATMFGYVTFFIAAMVGLNVAGVDFTKLAIVAGALSVGIGFGLQNIVNNFISGIILLFERPVRVGDYIKVGGVEGFVRRIRIRSTEVEGSNATTIIVPNSELISSKVENATYINRVGRVIFPVTVACSEDPKRVKELILSVAQGNDLLVQSGDLIGISGPSVAMKDFSGGSLQFELRASVNDIRQRSHAASELRFAVHEVLREQGISLA